MRHLHLLHSHPIAPASRPRVIRQPATRPIVGAAKPAPRRCLNEGGHKLFR